MSSTACLGILRRAEKRGKELPPQLRAALEIQAAVDVWEIAALSDMEQGVVVFAANQRDEVRDLHDVAGAIQSQPGMKQQTFVAQCLNPWDTQQARISVPDGIAPTMAGADGQGGRNPAGLIMAAGFCAGAAPTAGRIGYQEECSPTLKTGESGTNMVPSILCLNDQGGQRMDLYENMTGTLRAQMDGHPPLVFENHGMDSRYKGPLEIAPTVQASYGAGGNNTSLVSQPKIFCLSGNTIDRQPQNGGNGLGCQEQISYTLTATDHHAVFSQQRSDEYLESAVTSTQGSRQYKDATDLIYQQTVGTLVASDRKGPNSQYVSDDKCVIMPANFVRRLTPLECERLQGFPDFWTDIRGPRASPAERVAWGEDEQRSEADACREAGVAERSLRGRCASDSARYKALGNSVAIPCVEHVLRGVSYFLHNPDSPAAGGEIQHITIEGGDANG